MNYIWNVWAVLYCGEGLRWIHFPFSGNLKLFTQELASVYFFQCAFLTLRHCFIHRHHCCFILEIPEDQHEHY